jgi:hypothetical protein
MEDYNYYKNYERKKSVNKFICFEEIKPLLITKKNKKENKVICCNYLFNLIKDVYKMWM